MKLSDLATVTHIGSKEVRHVIALNFLLLVKSEVATWLALASDM